MTRIVPCLWFDTQALEAAEYYCSVFDDARILEVSHYSEAGPQPAGTVMVVEWEIHGQRFMGLNGGPQFTFDEAVSFMITCETQEQLDAYWEQLTRDGEEGPCGWCKDRFGLSWQLVPKGMVQLLDDPDRERAARAMKAMLSMRKLDLAAIAAAADAAAVG